MHKVGCKAKFNQLTVLDYVDCFGNVEKDEKKYF